MKGPPRIIRQLEQRHKTIPGMEFLVGAPVYRAAFRQPGDSALGVGGGGPKGLRNVGLWASPGLRLMIAVGKY